jgi:hypothetical protein
MRRERELSMGTLLIYMRSSCLSTAVGQPDYSSRMAQTMRSRTSHAAVVLPPTPSSQSHTQKSTKVEAVFAGLALPPNPGPTHLSFCAGRQVGSPPW